MKEKHILTSLNKYMFSAKNIDKTSERFLNNTLINNTLINNTLINNTLINNNNTNANANPSIIKNIQNDKTMKDTIIHPVQNDKFFWCFYIINYGIDNYNYVHHKSFQIEQEIKISSIEAIRKITPQLKLYKIKGIDIENELVNEKCISLLGFYALCIINDLSVIYVHNRTYFEININNTDVEYIIETDNSLNLKLHTDVGKDKINDIRNNYYKIENIKKPLRAISSYKLDDLKLICKKLLLQVTDANGKIKKKAELYENIVMKI